METARAPLRWDGSKGRLANPWLPEWTSALLLMYPVLLILNPFVEQLSHSLFLYLIPVLIAAQGGAAPGATMLCATVITHTAFELLLQAAPPLSLVPGLLLFAPLASAPVARFSVDPRHHVRNDLGPMVVHDMRSPLSAVTASKRWVEDNGEGIPAEFHEHLFDTFGQVATRQGRRKKSTGPGLAFRRPAVEVRGSMIHLESAPGEGARVFFSPPLATAGPGSGGVRGAA